MYLLVNVGGKDKFMTGFDLQAGRFRDAKVKGVMRLDYPSLLVLRVAKKNPGDFHNYLTENIKYHKTKLLFFEKQLRDLETELGGMK